MNDQKKKNIENYLKELEEDRDYKDTKEKLDKGENFIDYFLIIGLEPTIYRNDWLFSETLKTIETKYKDELKPKIISSFPNYEKSTISYDDSIIVHCFPNGYELIKSSVKPPPKIFSFILDNNYFNVNYPQKYLTSLIFYESIQQYKILSEMEKSRDNDIKKINQNNLEIKEPQIYIPKCLLIMSLYPYFSEFEKIISEIYNYSQNKKIELDDQKKSNTPLNKIVFQKMKTFSEKIKPKNINIPIDRVIENLLIELPAPPRGVTKVKYFLNEEQRTIEQYEMNQVPLIDVNLLRIFFDFKPKDVINIYNNIFLESRILFFSKSIECLNNYIYGLLAFLYPFQYQYQIVTILPAQNFEIIESITPFIAGINQSYTNDFFEQKGFLLSDKILVVDIDRRKLIDVNLQEELPDFPSKYRKVLEKKLQEVVSKYFKLKAITKLINLQKQKNSMNLSNQSSGSESTKNTSSEGSKITEKEKKVDTSNDNTDEDNNSLININEEEYSDAYEIFNNFNIVYNFNKEISEIFFNFNANLLSNYNKSLNREFYSSNTTSNLDILFKVPEYLKTIPTADKKFYDKFIKETQIFGDFIYLRMIPKNSKEKMRILKFDEKINENSGAKTSDVFSTTKEYEFVNNLLIQGPRPLTPKEIEFYKNEDNKINLISYGIIATEDKTDDKKIIFQYPIFPKLTIIYFLKDNINLYFPPNNLNGDIDVINEDIISKSHLGDVSLRMDDMKKYIYLCWMQMWALTFWYCQDEEKRYRFQVLIDIITNNSYYEMEVFNLLFEVLSVYGKDYMVLKLYSILIDRKLNPSFKVHNIVMKISEKNKMGGKLAENLKALVKTESRVVYKKDKFNKRTFKSKYYPYILTENILFYAFDTCIFCFQKINLETVSKNFKKMSRDLNWIKCPNPNCPEYLLPKLTIQFGFEINKNGDMIKNTSNFETVVLFSPYILKNNYNTSFHGSKVGIKLDVDDLMFKYSNIFWNSLWYFKLIGLEYDMMQPYYYRLPIIKPYPEFEIKFENRNNNLNDSNNDEDKNSKIKKFNIALLKTSQIQFNIIDKPKKPKKINQVIFQ